jgi:hypothetical protein
VSVVEPAVDEPVLIDFGAAGPVQEFDDEDLSMTRAVIDLFG